jgi:uncharacterized protein YndB with AHSA1/START domain
MTTATTTVQVYSVYIKAPRQAVWDAITKPEWTEKFGYGGRADYDLRKGGRYVHAASAEMKSFGAPDTVVDGEVLEVDPPNRLVQTWRMLMDPELVAEGFTRLTYELDEREAGVTKLTITHDLTGTPRLATLVSGRFEDEGGGGGWAWVLSDLKTLLETGHRLAD